ncbi:hypothetical protein [Roseateles toxinivorans]|uniref:Uncharacterized protein n=1 Tax=Roseateles toxinivorans TaxID=270368 RepID=A0A4R6QIH2_9BURK|nr:hypothetical protein [Roseateles toxinivorans]TDP62728.1 hypothetical protein DES47_10623 [Roseateles toxinivorans]
MSDNFFAPPAFKPDQALLQLKRALRDLRQLSERGSEFLLKGQTIVELSADETTLTAKLAKRPARSPEWDTRVCKSSADVRTLQDEIKKRLVRWTDETS